MASSCILFAQFSSEHLQLKLQVLVNLLQLQFRFEQVPLQVQPPSELRFDAFFLVGSTSAEQLQLIINIPHFQITYVSQTLHFRDTGAKF